MTTQQVANRLVELCRKVYQLFQVKPSLGWRACDLIWVRNSTLWEVPVGDASWTWDRMALMNLKLEL